MKQTLWEKDITINNKQKNIPINTDILIIGGGMAGVHTAFYLKDSKYQITVIDKGNIGMGMTKRTTGKITYLQDNIYPKIKSYVGKDAAKKYLHSQKKAISYLLKNIQNYNIACDLKSSPSYLFCMEDDLLFSKEEKMMNQMKVKYHLEQLPIHFQNKNAIKVNDTYDFHPLKYLYALKDICEEKNISFIPYVTAEKIEEEQKGYICHTNQGIIHCKIIVCTTHYPFFINPLFVPLKTHLEQSYVIVSKNKKEHFNAITPEDKTHSIRYYKDYLLYTGYNHKLGSKTDISKNTEKHRERFQKYFDGDIDYKWNAFDIITEDCMPLIGEIKKDFYVATGFNKWGMTNGTLAGKMIADLILQGNNPYQDLFNPKRGIIFHKFLLDGFQTGKSFIKSKLISSIHLKKDKKEYYYEYHDGNQIHKVCAKCPHMGCTVLLNKEEKTWDCPCHGSKFTIDGDLIKGPSTSGIKKKD